MFLLLLLCKSSKAQDDIVNTGNLQIHSGASFVFIGDFTNNGTYVDAGTVVLDGAVEQTLAGSGTISFNNLTIANTSATGVVLSGGAVTTVSGVLTLTDGFVYSSASNLLNLADGATISGGSSDSYIIGPLRKTGNDAFTFHIGKAGYYMPIGITAPNTATDVFTAEYFRADPKVAYGSAKDAAFNKITDNEYWTLLQNNGSTSENITLQWNGNTSNIGNLGELRVANWNGNQWDNLGNSSTTGTNSDGTILATTATNTYTAFTFGTTTINNPLPVTLLTFNAVLNNSQVDLNWITASEVNNDYFTIEKTRDGGNFEFVDKVKGAGNSNQKLYYKTVDFYPFEGLSYYRLKQTNFDGSHSFSELVPIARNAKNKITVFPNPSVNGYVTIALQNYLEREIKIEILDINGKIVHSSDYHINKDENINLPVTFKSGIYNIRIISNSLTTNNKLIIN